MIDRPIRRSASMACAFIALSLMPASAPKISITAASTSRSGATAGRTSAALKATISTLVVALGPYRCTNWAAKGIVTSAPTLVARPTSPSVPLLRCSRPAIHGRREANVPLTTPLTKNVTPTARRSADATHRSRANAATHAHLMAAHPAAARPGQPRQRTGARARARLPGCGRPWRLRGPMRARTVTACHPVQWGTQSDETGGPVIGLALAGRQTRQGESPGRPVCRRRGAAAAAVPPLRALPRCTRNGLSHPAVSQHVSALVTRIARVALDP